MVRWEYKVLHGDAHPNDIFSAMSRAGRDGWELSCVVGKYVYLKRPAPSDKEGGE